MTAQVFSATDKIGVPAAQKRLDQMFESGTGAAMRSSHKKKAPVVNHRGQTNPAQVS